MNHHETIPADWFRPMPDRDLDSLVGMEGHKHTLRAEIDAELRIPDRVSEIYPGDTLTEYG